MGIDILVLLGFSPWFAVVFCTFAVFCWFFLLLDSLALLLLLYWVFPAFCWVASVDLLGCLGAFCDYVLIPSALCWVLLRYWVLTALCWARFCSFTGFYPSVFMHDSIASLAGFFQFSCDCVLSFGSLIFLGSASRSKPATSYHWFSPANHSIFTKFSCHWLSLSKYFFRLVSETEGSALKRIIKFTI